MPEFINDDHRLTSPPEHRRRCTTCNTMWVEPESPSVDTCVRCEIRAAVDDGDHARAYAIAEDCGILGSVVRRVIRDSNERALRLASARKRAADKALESQLEAFNELSRELVRLSRAAILANDAVVEATSALLGDCSSANDSTPAVVGT